MGDLTLSPILQSTHLIFPPFPDSSADMSDRYWSRDQTLFTPLAKLAVTRPTVGNHLNGLQRRTQCRLLLSYFRSGLLREQSVADEGGNYRSYIGVILIG